MARCNYLDSGGAPCSGGALWRVFSSADGTKSSSLCDAHLDTALASLKAASCRVVPFSLVRAMIPSRRRARSTKLPASNPRARTANEENAIGGAPSPPETVIGPLEIHETAASDDREDDLVEPSWLERRRGSAGVKAPPPSRFHALASVGAEAVTLTEDEFAASHSNIAVIVEQLVAAASSTPNDGPTWSETWADREPIDAGEPRNTRPLDDRARVLWLERGRHGVGPFVFRLGRDPECEVALPNPRISRFHATVRFLGAETGWAVEDLDSMNGIILNGVAVRRGQREWISDGDVLVLGHVAVLRPFFSPRALHQRLRIGTRRHG